MPQSTEKDSLSQEVGKKSELDTLYSRLVHCYIPFPNPCFLPPFPLQLIAQARAWRGYQLPDRLQLVEAIQEVDAAKGAAVQNVYRIRGESQTIPGTVIDVGKESASWFTLDDGTIAIRFGWLGTLLVLTETLFRVLRVIELELEEIVPDFILSRGMQGRSEAAEERSRAEFVRMWQERKTRASLQWVLAAGKIPLGIGGRPPIIAPQLAGAAIAVRLQREGVDETKASSAAAGLTSVLLNRVVRPDEIRHWRNLFHRVKVRSEEGSIPLPQYLSCQLAEDKRLQEMMEIPSPATILSALTPPTSTCVDLASLIPQIQRERTPHPAKKESSLKPRRPLQREWLFTCRLCNSSEMHTDEIWPHLQNHGISEDEMEIPDANQKSICRKGTEEVLATLRHLKI